jgi:hypothetical protein
MANTTIRNQPNLTGLPPNAQREFEFLRSYAYKLLGKDGGSTQASSFKQVEFTYNGHPILTLPSSPVESTVQVYRNGLLLRRGKEHDYLISGRILELRPGAAALTGDWIEVTYDSL